MLMIKQNIQIDERVKIHFLLPILSPAFRSDCLLMANISNLFIINKNY